MRARAPSLRMGCPWARKRRQKESCRKSGKTRRRFSAEEKIRIVIAGLRGEESIATLCRTAKGCGALTPLRNAKMPIANSSRIANLLYKHRIWLEVIALVLVLTGLAITIYELAVARTLREAQLITMASEMVRLHRSEMDPNVREQQTGIDTHGRVASAARYILERAADRNMSLAAFNASHTNLADANLAGADFRGGKFHRVNLLGADLSGANFQPYPTPTGYQAERRELRADLSEADLSGADLSNAKLSMANLSRAVLRHSVLRMADFLGTNLTQADLSGADLSAAINLTQSQLDDACGDDRTLLLQGLEIKECQKSTDPISAPVTHDSLTDQTMTYQSFTGDSDNTLTNGLAQGAANTDENIPLITLTLDREFTYRFSGICDSDCLDLDLALYDRFDNEVSGDYFLDAQPILSYTPQETSEFRLEVIMVTCLLEPCFWSLQVSQGAP